MNAHGLVGRILAKIKEAKTPERFTQDYLAKTLGFASGSAKPFIPLAKRIGFLSSDGRPTELYGKFRDPNHSKTAMADAVRHGFSDLFARNETAGTADDVTIRGLIVQATGLDAGSSTLRAIVGTFDALKSMADFTSRAPPAKGKEKDEAGNEIHDDDEKPGKKHDLRLGLSYNISLVLPKTDDVAVFNAIFKALRENLLRS
jgi:hypothetical protein